MASTTAAARGLGWASIGIGLTEVAAPRRLERLMGIEGGQNTSILRLMGLREILQGIDILSHRDPTPGVWARVFGDVVDVALLGAAARRTRRPMGLGAAFAMVAGIAAMDFLAARSLSRQGRRQRVS